MDSCHILKENSHSLQFAILLFYMFFFSGRVFALAGDTCDMKSVFVYEIIVLQKHTHPHYICGISPLNLHDGIDKHMSISQFAEQFYANAYFMPEIESAYIRKMGADKRHSDQAFQLRQMYINHKSERKIRLSKQTKVIIRFLNIDGTFWKENNIRSWTTSLDYIEATSYPYNKEVYILKNFLKIKPDTFVSH